MISYQLILFIIFKSNSCNKIVDTYIYIFYIKNLKFILNIGINQFKNKIILNSI
jgi:hypothetical protein